MSERAPISVLATGLDVDAIVSWISEIPITEWPSGDPHVIRPAMITNPEWRGFGERVEGLVQKLMSMAARSAYAKNRWLSVVMPGHTIEPHTDAAEPGWLSRIHVPLITNPNALTMAGEDDEPYQMQVGSAYWFDKTARHWVTNAGESPRIHFMFDVMRS